MKYQTQCRNCNRSIEFRDSYCCNYKFIRPNNLEAYLYEQDGEIKFQNNFISYRPLLTARKSTKWLISYDSFMDKTIFRLTLENYSFKKLLEMPGYIPSDKALEKVKSLAALLAFT